MTIPSPLEAEAIPARNLTATIQGIRRALSSQPRPDALATAQAALFPLLQAARIEVFNPQVLRHSDLPSHDRVRYQLQLADAGITFDIFPVARALKEAAAGPLPKGRTLEVLSNGRDWRFTLGKGDNGISLNLFDQVFPEVALIIFRHDSQPTLAERLSVARATITARNLSRTLSRLIAELGIESVREAAETSPEALKTLLHEHRLLLPENQQPAWDLTLIRQALDQSLRATELGLVRPAMTLAGITSTDVQRQAKAVRRLKGNLRVTFDGQETPITSRTGLYVVLAALALQHGREDAIPPEDLVRPPEPRPEGRKHRSLGRPGWYLALGREPAALEAATSKLLDVLVLRNRINASRNGTPYPAHR